MTSCHLNFSSDSFLLTSETRRSILETQPEKSENSRCFFREKIRNFLKSGSLTVSLNCLKKEIQSKVNRMYRLTTMTSWKFAEFGDSYAKHCHSKKQLLLEMIS